VQCWKSGWDNRCDGRELPENGSLPFLYTSSRLLRSFRVASSSGQQAVDIYLVLCAYVYMAIHHSRDVEAEGEAGAVTGGILPAIIQFTSDICSVVSKQNRGSVG
jgi:hypothetical protein